MFKDLIKDLVKIKYNFEIGKKTWFGTGGRSFLFLKINTLKSLVAFLKITPKKIPILIIGGGSNIIVRDGGFKGIIIRLGTEFKKISIDKKKSLLEIGSASKDSEISIFCLKKKIGGFEFLKGIPGTLGGNIKMNAGCYGGLISDSLVSCTVLKRNGRLKTLKKSQIKFEYRKTSIHEDEIVVSAKFKINFQKRSVIATKLKKISDVRSKTQPISSRTGGSTFANPANSSAWKLIDGISYRGKKLGGASVSAKHSNFLINENFATSLDLELLGEEIREKVWKKFKIKLDWELKRVGKFNKI